jgi:hypothetical protein
LEEARRLAEQLRQTVLDPPDLKKAKNIAKMSDDWLDNCCAKFLSDEGIEVGVEPTNKVSLSKCSDKPTRDQFASWRFCAI